MGRARFLTTLLSALAAGWTTPVTAQIPTEYTNLQVLPEDIDRQGLLGYMRDFSLSTGLRCNDCHVAENPRDFSTFDFASDEMREKRIAREMLIMVQRINDEILPGLPDRGSPEVEVGCVTCHSLRQRPATLEQELEWAFDSNGARAIEERYAQLRELYFGRGAYDFGARSLDNVAQAVFDRDTEAALLALEINLRHHPGSVSTWNLKANAHRQLDEREEAISAFERVLELQPNQPQAERALRELRGG